MAEYVSSEEARTQGTPARISIPYVVLSAVLIGVGMFGVTYWIVTFKWLYFASLIPLIGGAIMLFSRGTGPDRA